MNIDLLNLAVFSIAWEPVVPGSRLAGFGNHSLENTVLKPIRLSVLTCSMQCAKMLIELSKDVSYRDSLLIMASQMSNTVSIGDHTLRTKVFIT
jgi:hypothetical protein